MSGPMDAWDEALRETNRADDAERDRDHHSKRADAAEAEAAQLLADLAAVTAERKDWHGKYHELLDSVIALRARLGMVNE